MCNYWPQADLVRELPRGSDAVQTNKRQMEKRQKNPIIIPYFITVI
jgi:hypothetical protein